MATKLEDLLIKEVSGVDDPANEIPGFMVMKSADGQPTPETAGNDPATIVGKIKSLLTGKEDIDMTKDELAAELDSRFEAFGKGLTESLTETLSKAVEAAPAEAAAPVVETAAPAATPADEATPGLSAEDLTKAIEDGLQPVLEIMDAVIDRVAALEGSTATRKSLDGQDGEAGDGAPAKPSLGDAIGAALKGRKVELV